MLPVNVKGETCATRTDMCPRGKRTIWAIHNFLMYFTWVVLMAFVLCTARYFRHYWRKSIYLHTSFGILAFLITTAAVPMAWYMNYKKDGRLMHWEKWSSLFEEVASFYAWILTISGMVAWFYRRYGNYEWGTTRVL